MYGSIFCFLLSFFYVQRPGGRGLGGRVQSGDDLSVACGASSPSQGEPRGVRRSQCLPLLRGGAERSEAERFRRVAAAGMTSQALRASSPSQGEPRGVRRSQCLPLLRGGAERSEAERFRRVAAAGATSQALRASSPSQGEPRGLQEFPSAVPAEGKKRVPSFGSSWGG